MSQLVPNKPEEEQEESSSEALPKMGFLDHLEELRWTLIKPIAVFVITFVVVMIFIRQVGDLLMYPLFKNYSPEDIAAFRGLATRNPTGVFSAMMQIGLIVGIAVASPFFVFYMGRFLAPALTSKERKVLIPGSVGALILFLLGCSFAFFLLIPKAIQITMQFNEMMGFQIIWTPDSYFSFITWIVLGMGVGFEFPLVVLVLVYLNIVSVQKLRDVRKIAIMVILIVGALLTPPDPVTQLMMAVPLYVMYELSIVVAAFIVKKRDEAEEEDELEG